MDIIDKAVDELRLRRAARKDFATWCRLCGFEPARHHLFLIDRLTAAADRGIRKLMINMPPGSAKSTYSSKLFPPWFLSRYPMQNILACSCSTDLATHFGRESRNFLIDHEKELGVKLRTDSQAADEWAITQGGLFFCAGVGSKIAGRRADLALIDDPIGSREDAYSKAMREKVWNWYNTDFKTRLKPDAVIVLIQTRWHEDDLSGRLLATEANEWEVVRLPMIAKANDALGRGVGELLWDNYFTPGMVSEAKKDPATWSALYQQDPTPEDGDYFKREWIEQNAYNANELPSLSELRLYAASDHAVSEEQRADSSAYFIVGVDEKGGAWVLPDAEIGKWDTEKAVEKMLRLIKTYKPLIWWAEKDLIGRSILPFLRKRQMEEQAWCPIEGIVASKDKATRARSFQGRLSMGKYRFPRFASWYSDMVNQLLKAWAGLHDDMIDPHSLIGLSLDKLVGGKPMEAVIPDEIFLRGRPITLGWIKESHETAEREAMAFAD